MATTTNFSPRTIPTLHNSKNSNSNPISLPTYPDWYNPETGIYTSKHSPVKLPESTHLDVVSHIFSYQHDGINGVSALIDSSSGFSISYSKLFPLVKSMATGIRQKLGISQGDVVLLLLPNTVYYPIVFLGVLYLGAIVTTMNPLSSLSEIKRQVSDSNVSVAFTSCDKIDTLEKLGVLAVGVPENVDGDVRNGERSFFYELLSSGVGLDLVPRPIIRQDDTAVIVYSSGTTGMSKGVLLTHRNLIAMVELFVRFEASQYEYSCSENVYVAVLPMFHIYGQSLFVMGLLSLGCRIVVMKRFKVDEVVEAIDKYGVTHFPVVPPILAALTKAVKGAGGKSLKSLKQVSSGAATVNRTSVEEFVQALPHVDFIQGYGMSESTAVGTRGFNTKEFRKYFSIGLLAPNMQAKILDCKTGTCLPPGHSGELLLRGPAIMKGYLNNVDATTLAFDEDGWLHSGDIIYFDEDGYLHILDRVKEIIKYKGYQIAPADLEAVLISHPEIDDVAVIGASDAVCEEIPVAFVVKRHGSTLTQEAIINYVAEQVAPYKKVRKVVFTDLIPKSPSGKILRRVLKNFLSSRL